MDKWQVPLQRKQIKRQRKLLNPVVPNMPKPEIFYVHNPAEGVLVPPNPEQMFAVVRVKGIQYKVVKDDRVMMEKLPFDIG